MSSLNICLIGYGAIGQAIAERLANHPRARIASIVVRPERMQELQALKPRITVLSQVPADAQLVLECAGHSALRTHVLPSLQRGIPSAVLSVGALSEIGLPEELARAAGQGQTQVHLLSGAIGGIDAIAAAKLAGLSSVRYTGRKPPLAWKGTPAESQFNLQSLADTAQSATIFEATARDAAAQYPKNANVAATIALAGLGLDATQVRLIADSTCQENVHEIEIEGAFGRMKIEMHGKPLPSNPKTSLLTVLAALRFIDNCVMDVVV